MLYPVELRAQTQTFYLYASSLPTSSIIPAMETVLIVIANSTGGTNHRSRRYSRPHETVAVSTPRFTRSDMEPSNGPVRRVRRRRLCLSPPRRDCRLDPLWAGLH